MSSDSPERTPELCKLGASYLDLMKKCLTFSLWEARDGSILELGGGFKLTLYILALRLKRALQRQPYDAQMRNEGRDWPRLAETMAGPGRLENVQYCVENALRDGVPGDLIETGVWRGGTTIFMRAILKAYDITDRKVWVADSFEGLPKPDAEKYPSDAGDKHHSFKSLAISLDQVQANFKKYSLLDEQVCFLKGWFKDTLPFAPITKLAVIRLDGDMYESTMDGLTHLYPKLSPSGFVIVDDYGSVPACRQAVEDYRKAKGIREEIQRVDWSAVYWRRSA